MALRPLGWSLWVSLLAGLWALQPLLLSQARGIVVLALLVGVLAGLGIATGTQLCVVWSGALGVINLGLALLITVHPTSLWVGLSAGLLLLGLLDGQQSLIYLRHCQVESGVTTALLGAYVRLSSWSLLAGISLTVLLVQLSSLHITATAAGYLTIVGAGIFVAFFAAFLLATSQWTERKNQDDVAETLD